MISQSDREFLEELRRDFVPEAEEYLQTMVSGLLDMERGASSGEDLEEIYRAAHSLKGAAQAVQMPRISEVCQIMESVFSEIKKENLEPSGQDFDTLQRAVDLLADMVAAGGEDRGQAAEMKKNLEMILLPPFPSAPPLAAQEEEGAGMPAVSFSDETYPSLSLPEQDEEPPSPASPARGTARETVRVTASKLDALVLEAEELISINQNFSARLSEVRDLRFLLSEGAAEWSRARSLLKGFPADSLPARFEELLEGVGARLRQAGNFAAVMEKALQEGGETAQFLISNLLEEARSTVMLPFSTLLQGFPKIARDLSKGLEKEADLRISGGDVEVDKRILEGLKDPLIHLVRNALDHGLESSGDRRRAGKRERGEIVLSVSSVERGRVEITLSDDGRGMDPGILKEKGVASGVVSEAEAKLLSDEAALALVFQSGLSTSTIITEVSGRGLGMAIVREGVENLGGKISLTSTLGKGTAFTISLPVTLATFRGVIVEEWGQQFVFPTANVRRVSRIFRADVEKRENWDRVVLDGRPYGLVRLGLVLELQAPENRETGDAIPVVVAGTGDSCLAFAVDRVADEQEVILKSLGEQLKRVRNIAGVTVLGTGKVVPVLHCGDLVKSASRESFRGGLIPEAKEEKPLTVLVAEDSITSRTLLRNILTSAGYNVLTAADGKEALDTLMKEGADLVVSDVEMPRMDGFELTSRIRAGEGLSDTPVILVTSMESAEDRERGAEAGADAYIVKSAFDQGALLDVIRRLT